jgi:hypothetical protein
MQSADAAALHFSAASRSFDLNGERQNAPDETDQRDHV